MTKKNKVYMAFGAGRPSASGDFVKYIGVAPVNILTVNPTKQELETIYGRELEKEIEYLGETKESKVPTVRLDFIVKTIVAKCKVDLTTKVSFFLQRECRYNNDKTKIQVINKYGETAWIPVENVKTGVIPENLSWFEAADIRPAYVGEEDVTNFLRTYLNIPNKSYRDKNGRIVELQDKTEAEARLDNIEDLFKGKFEDLKGLVSLQPENIIKVLFGIKTTEDNKQYQTVYTQKVLKSGVKDYSKLDEEIQKKREVGALKDTEYLLEDIKEYVVESTDFSNMPVTGVTSTPWGSSVK